MPLPDHGQIIMIIMIINGDHHDKDADDILSLLLFLVEIMITMIWITVVVTLAHSLN